MTPGWSCAPHPFYLGLLRAASLLAPAGERGEWWLEWRAELWHVCRLPALPGAAWWRAQRQVTAFCLGAFRDAACLRRQLSRQKSARPRFHGSAAECLAWFAAALAACFALAHLLPGVRVAGSFTHLRINPGLVLIRDARVGNGAVPSIPISQFRVWKARPQRYFDGFAFYRIVRETVSLPASGSAHWAVAHSSSNLFWMLGLPIRFAGPEVEEDRDLPGVIVSCEVFERQFEGNPGATGAVVQIGRQSARIAGVAPCGAWTLPGKVDAWLLEPEATIGSGPKQIADGYVLAHLSSIAQNLGVAPPVQITTYNSDNSDEGFLGECVPGSIHGPWDMYLFALVLAFLCLPAVTSVSAGEYTYSPHKPGWPRRICRWAFFCSKMALLLPVAWYAPLDLAYCRMMASADMPQLIQLAATFCICLFGMRWILLDQHRRCPVCLRRVSNPAQVGDASRTFLAWNGTELICTSGHTLLHVPGLPTSWFGTPRWLFLDTSWGFLFAGSGEG